MPGSEGYWNQGIRFPCFPFVPFVYFVVPIAASRAPAPSPPATRTSPRSHRAGGSVCHNPDRTPSPCRREPAGFTNHEWTPMNTNPNSTAPFLSLVNVQSPQPSSDSCAFVVQVPFLRLEIRRRLPEVRALKRHRVMQPHDERNPPPLVLRHWLVAMPSFDLRWAGGRGNLGIPHSQFSQAFDDLCNSICRFGNLFSVGANCGSDECVNGQSARCK